MELLTPTSLNDAFEMLANAARGGIALTPIAGGTDLCVSWPSAPKNGLRLLDLSRIESELRPFRLRDSHLELGGLTTYWDVLQSPDVIDEFPLLGDAARQVGAIQIQTRGTWAGNVGNASPAADGVPVLMAYDATVVLQSRTGRTEVALHEYYTGYKQSVRQSDQLIVAVRIPRRRREHEWFHKVGARAAQAITKVGVALVKDDMGWRVVANSVAPTVCRCRRLEAALDAGQSFASPAEICKTLTGDVSPIDDLRSTARYRANVLSRLLYHWLLENHV